jgi:hypothetical protein
MLVGVFLAAMASSAFLQVDELDQQLKKLIGPLGSEKPEEREAARAELRRLVGRNRKIMRRLVNDLLKREKDPEVRAALIDGAAKTYSMDDLSFEAVFPKETLTVREAGSSNTRFRMRVRNNDDEEIVLIRDFKLSVLDPEGMAVRTSTYWGAGYRPSGCFLAAAAFLRIPAGHVMEWEEILSAYQSEMRVFQGYEPPKPGVYTLRFTVGYDREAFKKGCRDGCAGHDLADKPWNQALEGKRTFDVKLTLREETAEEQAAAKKLEEWMVDLMDRYRTRKITVTELHAALDRAKLDSKNRQRVLSVTQE